MTENLKNAMLGINQFVWTAINYGMTLYKFHLGDREVYVPRFVAEPDWDCDTDHFVSKWLGIIDDMPDNTYGWLIKFYLQLGNHNQLALMEWIMNNPVDERKLYFPSNEED